MPDPRQHTQQRGAIEVDPPPHSRLSRYLEKEYRRESDALQREWLADCLHAGQAGTGRTSRTLADAGDIDSLPQWDRVRLRIDKLAAGFAERCAATAACSTW